MPRPRKRDMDGWFDLGYSLAAPSRRRRRSRSARSSDLDWAPRRRSRRGASADGGCLGPFLLIGVLGYILVGMASGVMAAISQRPELVAFLVVAAALFLVTGLPALVFLAIWLKRRGDHARRVKVWHWQQLMKRFGAEYGSAYTGPPQEWIAALSWSELERLAAEIFSRLGYQTRSVGRSGDRGIDVHMVNPAGGIEVVQCKQWGTPSANPMCATYMAP